MSLKRGFNGTRQIIDIPANTGAYQAILATGPVVYVKVVESTLTSTGAPNTLQGFNYKLPNDQFTQELAIPASVVLEIGDRMGLNSRHGSPLGNGPDEPGAGVPARAATTLFEAQSATATGTSIEVTQYY